MTTINTWAGTAGHITGRAWRTLVWIESEIDWAEVGHIVWHGLLAFTVGVYVAGEFTGRWVHRTSAQLARLWVQLLVRGAAASSQRQTGVKFEVPLLPAAPAPLALPPARVIEPAVVHWFAVAPVPARSGFGHTVDPMARAVRLVRSGMKQRPAASLCGVSRSSLQRALKA